MSKSKISETIGGDDEENRNLDSTNQTAIHAAVNQGNLDAVKILLEKDPSLVDERDDYNFNVLHRAVERGDIDIVKFLVEEREANVSVPVNELYGNGVLHVAAAAGTLDVLKYFIEERHMDPNLKNYYGQPVAFSAASHKQLDVIKYLAEQQRVDLTVVDAKNENILFTCVTRRDMRIPRYLLDDRKLKLDINWRGQFGRTVLFYAARIRATHFTRYFVEDRYADVNVIDDNGQTPLHEAALHNNLQTIKLLVKHKARVRNVDKKGRMPIDLASDATVKRYLQILLNRRNRRSIPHVELFVSQKPISDEIRDLLIAYDPLLSNYSIDPLSLTNQIIVPPLNTILVLINIIFQYLH